MASGGAATETLVAWVERGERRLWQGAARHSLDGEEHAAVLVARMGRRSDGDAGGDEGRQRSSRLSHGRGDGGAASGVWRWGGSHPGESRGIGFTSHAIWRSQTASYFGPGSNRDGVRPRENSGNPRGLGLPKEPLGVIKIPQLYSADVHVESI
jgi:hypothetical protein